MTIQSRTTVKGKFEDGDTPQGSDYADWIDSFLHLTDSTAQAVTSPLTLGTVRATTVSAATVSAQDINGSAASFLGKVNAATVSAQRVTASAATILGTVSAATVHVNTLIINAATSIAAAASASKYIEVTVSGETFWVALRRAT